MICRQKRYTIQASTCEDPPSLFGSTCSYIFHSNSLPLTESTPVAEWARMHAPGYLSCLRSTCSVHNPKLSNYAPPTVFFPPQVQEPVLPAGRNWGSWGRTDCQRAVWAPKIGALVGQWLALAGTLTFWFGQLLVSLSFQRPTIFEELSGFIAMTSFATGATILIYRFWNEIASTTRTMWSIGRLSILIESSILGYFVCQTVASLFKISFISHTTTSFVLTICTF